MSHWETVTIGDVAEIFDGPHATPQTVESGPVFLGIGSLQDGRLDLSETRHVTPEDFKIWTRRVKPRSDDVVFSYETRIGQAAIIPEGLECCLGRRMGLVRVNRARLEPRFFLYYYLSPSYQLFLQSKTIHGATVDRLALTEFPSFPISLPPIHEQRAIAHVLGRLDDKIELNRQMNETLEAMARALFKEWFVEFGPVRAKMEGRQPDGLAPEIADLFPDRFDHDGTPVGWHTDALLQHAQLISGGTPKTTVDAYWQGPILWASAKDVSQCRETFLLQTERTITSRGLLESSTRLIPQFATVIVARGATTGRFCMFGREMAMNQTCYALHSLKNYNFWLNCMFGNLVNNLLQAAHGSVFDTITTKTLDAARIIIPSESLLQRFEDIVTPLFSRILLNIEESSTLAQLRDLLLPKLMSGEIRLKDAERLVAETL
jgi:type I restriction enzyme S subunit